MSLPPLITNTAGAGRSRSPQKKWQEPNSSRNDYHKDKMSRAVFSNTRNSLQPPASVRGSSKPLMLHSKAKKVRRGFKPPKSLKAGELPRTQILKLNQQSDYLDSATDVHKSQQEVSG